MDGITQRSGTYVAMTPDKWKKVEDLFDAAVGLADTQQQAAFVARECGNDNELRHELGSLLAHSTGASAAVQKVVSSAAANLTGSVIRGQIGRHVGPYRLVEQIGAGGMGVVYLAERDDDQYRRRVAIKILPHGLGSSQAVARFRDERQILATLEHPGIVRLLDGGTTDDGLPYLVMEYVDGSRIGDYAKHITVRAKVELVRQVCRALQYAHGKLIVHRDLKPGNILVDKAGIAKVLDFGIAKLLSSDPAVPREARTQTGAALLTPDYASPEQVRGEPVAVTSDVYSLGAVLYELLAGQTPLRMAGNPLEALRTICEVEPPRPSAVAPEQVRRELAGDLDNIVLKALQKETERRYASVEQLADDLGRYLQGLPVLARDATVGYRAGKFVKRNKGKLGLATLVLTALTTATVISVRQAHRADLEAQLAGKRFNDVRRLANSLLFDIDSKLQNLTGATGVREVVVSRALEYLDRIAAEKSNSADLSRELALAYMRVGDIQGNGYEPNLGKAEEGLASYAKAAAIIEKLRATGHDDAQTQRLHLTAMFGKGLLEHSADQLDRSRATLNEAFTLAKSLPTPREFDPYVFRAYLSLAYFDREADPASAAVAIEKLLELATAWQRDAPSAGARYALGVALGMRAELRGTVADADGAVHDAEAALATLQELSRSAPDDVRFSRELVFQPTMIARYRGGIGNVEMWASNLGDTAGAERALRDALPGAELLGRDVHDARAVDQLVGVLYDLGALQRTDDPAASAALFARGHALYEALPADARSNLATSVWFGACMSSEPLARLGRRDDALARIAEGLAITEHDATSDKASSDDKLYQQMCRYASATTFRVLGEEARAVALLESATTDLQAYVASHPRVSTGYTGLAQSLEMLAELQPANACALRTRAIEQWARWPLARTPYIESQVAQLKARVATCTP